MSLQKSMEATLENLQTLTKEFLDLYFKNSTNQEMKWSDLWNRVGNFPNNSKRGIYAFLNSEKKIIYIGVGAKVACASKYETNGIANRVFQRLNLSTPKDELGRFRQKKGWEDLEYVITFPFKTSENLQEDDSYMAYAFEQFLIRRIRPVKNKVGIR